MPEFIAQPGPSSELCRAVAARAPENPFYTPAYIDARRALDFEPWILGVRRYLSRKWINNLTVHVEGLGIDPAPVE